MPSYQVVVGEVLPPETTVVQPGEPTPEVRSLICRVEAPDDEAAANRASWGHIWQAKYGPVPPADVLVEVPEIEPQTDDA